MSTSDKKLRQKAKALFDESVDGLDAATLSRLNRGRHAALAEAGRSRRREFWIPATGAAAALAVAAVMLQSPGDGPVIEAPAADLEILLGEESIDMLEDLEFYSWLEMADLDDGGDIG